MKCSKCGKEINEKVKFCKYCGSPVEYDGQKATETDFVTGKSIEEG